MMSMIEGQFNPVILFKKLIVWRYTYLFAYSCNAYSILIP